ncbi:MAG: hypothetical protein NUV70_07075, partial [Caldiserica bacterium]|nr:hypothetical protein [Caldisericota bacterium]
LSYWIFNCHFLSSFPSIPQENVEHFPGDPNVISQKVLTPFLATFLGAPSFSPKKSIRLSPGPSHFP